MPFTESQLNDYLQKVDALAPSRKAPKSKAAKRVRFIITKLNPLWWLWKGTTWVFNRTFGSWLGSTFFVPPLLEHYKHDKVIEQLIANENFETIIDNALKLDKERKTPIAPERDILLTQMMVGSQPIKTDDHAVLEQYWTAPKNLMNDDQKTFKDPKTTELILCFEGRTQHPLHRLPGRLLQAHQENCAYASFAYRGLMFKQSGKTHDELAINIHQFGLRNRHFKKLRKAKQTVYDGMAFVAHYLRQGFLPKNIFFNCYSMGGVGIIVADRYNKIFKRFDESDWAEDTEFLEYAQWLFGKENASKAEFISHINELKKDKLSFAVFADRNYSTLSAASAGVKVMTPIEKWSWQRFEDTRDNKPFRRKWWEKGAWAVGLLSWDGKMTLAQRKRWENVAWIAGWISWPFFKIVQVLSKWEIDVLSAYQRLDHKLKAHTGVKPAFPDKHKRDALVHEFAALTTALKVQENDVCIGYVPIDIANQGSTEYTHAAMETDIFCKNGTSEMNFLNYFYQFKNEVKRHRINHRHEVEAEEARVRVRP